MQNKHNLAHSVVSFNSLKAYDVIVLLMCRKKRFKRFRSAEFQNSIVSSLTSNALYVAHHDSVFSQLPYNKYTTVRRIVQCIGWHCKFSCYYHSAKWLTGGNEGEIFVFTSNYYTSKQPHSRGIYNNITVLVECHFVHCIIITIWYNSSVTIVRYASTLCE